MLDKILINNQIEIPTKVAITEEEHIRGLMFQKEAYILAFPYDRLAIRKFWMKDTFVPLDIIFCCAGQIIKICSGIPLDETLVGPDFLCDLVIEMPAGYAKKYGFYNNMNTVKLQLCRKTQLRSVFNKLSSIL